MKKLPKAIENRINEINSLIHLVENLDECPYTYAGGTWPHYVEIKPILVKGLKVTIEAKNAKQSHNYITKETYKANDLDFYSFNGLTSLKYDLGIILKAFKKALK